MTTHTTHAHQRANQRYTEAKRQLDYWMKEYAETQDQQALDALNRAHATLDDSATHLASRGGR